MQSAAGPMAVTDPASVRRHGLGGARVVDASVMPVTNGDIGAPVMMIAEKTADLIRGDTPLPAAPMDFYRHGQAVAGPVKRMFVRNIERSFLISERTVAYRPAPQRGIL